MASSPKGKAVIEILLDSGQLERQLKTVEDNFKKVGANIARIGAGLSGFGVGILGGLTLAANKAGDALEVLNRFEAVFKGASAEAKAFAESLAKDIGRTESDILSALSSYQAFFVGLGKGEKEAATLSKTLASLALDFASFNNLSDEDAQSRFLSGLSGSSEVFDRFGINTKKAALDQKFFQQGLDVTTATATETQKVMARLAIIMESLGRQGAIGDAKKTADSYNNSLKALKSSFQTLLESVGKPLLNTFAQISKAVAIAVKGLSQFIAANPKLVKQVFAGAAAITALGTALLAIGGTLIATGATFGLTSFAVAGFSSAFATLTATLVAFKGILAAVLASPLTTIIALLAVAGNEYVNFGEIVSKVTKTVKSEFATAFATGQESFDKLVNAIKAGSLEQAVIIASNGVKLALTQAFATPIEIALKAFALMKRAVNDATAGFNQLGLTALQVLVKIGLGASKGADLIFSSFSRMFQRLQQLSIVVVGELQKLWVDLGSSIKASIANLKGDEQGALAITKAAEQAKRDIDAENNKAIAKLDQKIKAGVESQITVNFEKALKSLDISKDKTEAERLKTDQEIVSTLAKQLVEMQNASELYKQNIAKADEIVKQQQATKKNLQGNGEDRLKTAADKVLNASKNFKFGQLVETGSSAALQLFGKNNDVQVKELQKLNKSNTQIVEALQGIEVR